MDCEGSEGHILKSIPNDYFLKIKSIVMEFHNNVSILNHNQIIIYYQTMDIMYPK